MRFFLKNPPFSSTNKYLAPPCCLLPHLLCFARFCWLSPLCSRINSLNQSLQVTVSEPAEDTAVWHVTLIFHESTTSFILRRAHRRNHNILLSVKLFKLFLLLKRKDSSLKDEDCVVSPVYVFSILMSLHRKG